jgi:hypothetical protein
MTSVKSRISKLEQNVQFWHDDPDIPRQRDARNTLDADPEIRLVLPEDTDPWTYAEMAATVSRAEGEFDLAEQILAARPPYPGEVELRSCSSPEERRRAMRTMGEAIALRAMNNDADWDNAIAKARERLGLPRGSPRPGESGGMGRGGGAWDRE